MREDFFASVHGLSSHKDGSVSQGIRSAATPRVLDDLDDAQRVLLAQQDARFRNEPAADQRVLHDAETRLVVLWRHQVPRNRQQQGRLRLRALALHRVNVHFIAVKVRVVHAADGKIESQRLSAHHDDAVRVEAEPMQRRLAVDDDVIAVSQVPLDAPAEA